ncbi:MAG: phytanoyl-CoA dioxygenase family protein [Bryobacteraceae bacterium]
MTPEQMTQLDANGWVHLPGFLSAEEVERLRTRIEELFGLEGDAAGSEFKYEEGSRRLANCVDKGDVFIDCIARPEILELVGHVLGDFKLSSLNVRSANPRNGISQPLHCDMGALPDEKGYWVCNTVWALDDFTTENGPPRVVAGTHRSGKLPQQVLADPAATHPDELLLMARAGDVIVMNAHLWHGGCANATDEDRRALHGFYCRRDKPQQQYQKAMLRPETLARLTVEQRRVLALDDPLNDELAKLDVAKSGFLK